jgi:hypothetical protein
VEGGLTISLPAQRDLRYTTPSDPCLVLDTHQIKNVILYTHSLCHKVFYNVYVGFDQMPLEGMACM